MFNYKFSAQNAGHSEHTQQHLDFQNQRQGFIGVSIPFSAHQHSIENKGSPNPCNLAWSDVRNGSEADGTQTHKSSFKSVSQSHLVAEDLFHSNSGEDIKPNLPPLPPPPLPPPLLHPVKDFHPVCHSNFHTSVPSIFCPSRLPPTARHSFASPHYPHSNNQNNNHGLEIKGGIPHSPLPIQPLPVQRTTHSPIQDEDWIHSWVAKGKKRLQLSKRKDRTLKISDIQKKLLSYANLISKLEKLSEQLSHESEDQIWNSLFEKSEHMKYEINHLNTYFSEERNKLIKEIVIHRREKRVKGRRFKKIKAARCQSQRVKWKQRELEIDHQLKQHHEEEKNKIIEEKVKKEADIILREVRSKQEDLHRMQKLLVALSELRNARLKKGEVHGYVTCSQADAFFSKAQSEFGELLPKQLSLYQEEEQTLKVMMEESKNPLLHSTSKRLTPKAQNTNKLKEELHEILFGAKNPLQSANEFFKSFTAAEESVEILINRRHSWDQFLVDPNNIMGSSVPIGWVVPNTQPNFEWSRFQHK